MICCSRSNNNKIAILILLFFSDGFQTFRNSYPEWCDSCSELMDNSGATMPTAAGPDPLPLMGLRSLRISATPIHRPHRSCDSLSSTANSSTDSSDTDDRCDSSLGITRTICVFLCLFSIITVADKNRITKILRFIVLDGVNMIKAHFNVATCNFL